jgi:hypothetical protein
VITPRAGNAPIAGVRARRGRSSTRSTLAGHNEMKGIEKAVRRTFESGARTGRASGIALLAVLLLYGQAWAQAPDAEAGKQLLREFAGNEDTDALLNHPAVRPQLERLLGEELPHLMRNLDVRGAVDVLSGELVVDGNAPHQGTEEEAVVCVNIYGLEVNAAILSEGAITVYSRQKGYENLPRCIKDWITQANSEHRDRFYQPQNVHMSTGD